MDDAVTCKGTSVPRRIRGSISWLLRFRDNARWRQAELSPEIGFTRQPSPVLAQVLARLRRARRYPAASKRPLGGLAYWQQRVEKHGAASVINLEHDSTQLARITREQEAILFPLLQSELRGDERYAIDFGCGPGRFTGGLATLIGGTATGVDPISELLALAPQRQNVHYMSMAEGEIPLPDRIADVVWICLVLGGILDSSTLRQTVAEIDRVLTDGGLLFLVENTKAASDTSYWAFRPVSWYEELFPQIPLRHLADYRDLDDVNSVFAGRKRGPPSHTA